jgi:hypothetical protein
MVFMLGMTEIIILGAMGVATILFLMIGAGMIGKRKNDHFADDYLYQLGDDGELIEMNARIMDEKPKHYYDRSR